MLKKWKNCAKMRINRKNVCSFPNAQNCVKMRENAGKCEIYPPLKYLIQLGERAGNGCWMDYPLPQGDNVPFGLIDTPVGWLDRGGRFPAHLNDVLQGRRGETSKC